MTFIRTDSLRGGAEALWQQVPTLMRGDEQQEQTALNSRRAEQMLQVHDQEFWARPASTV